MAYTKGRLLIDGGEGYIYEVAGNPHLLVKSYKETDSLGEPVITQELIDKLSFMINNPPSVLLEKKVIAWPLEAVCDTAGDGSDVLQSISGEIPDCFAGFVMPKLDMNEHLQRVYSYRHPVLDAEEYDKFPSVKSRISIAINLCSALHELHRAGYVIGDFNHRNIGVNYGTGQIYIVDCDSFHITDREGDVHRSNVIMAGYLAPEIISHCSGERAEGRDYNLDKVLLPTFTKESDLFCLAIHIFKLLMNGVDPYRGVKSDATGSTASPFVGNDAIERDAYVFKPGNKPSAVFCPPMESVPPELFSLFDKAFIQGRKDPKLRPNAEKWYHALNRFLNNDLMQCPKDAKHQHYKQLTQCPYCTADRRHMEAQGAGYGEPSLPIIQVNMNRQAVHVTQTGLGPQHGQQPGQRHGLGQQPVRAAQTGFGQQPVQTAQTGLGQQPVQTAQAGLGQQSAYTQQAGLGQQSAHVHRPKPAKSNTPLIILVTTAAAALVVAVILFLLLPGANEPPAGQNDNNDSGDNRPGISTPYPSAPSSSVISIRGVEYNTGLTELVLSEMGLTDAEIEPLRHMVNLTELWLSGNSISNVDVFSGLTNLVVLDIENNNISDISALSGLTKLAVLGLGENQISDISALSNMTDLLYLGLWDNQISDISVLSRLTGLIWLDLSKNQIVNINALSRLTDLAELYIWENYISDVSALAGLTGLTVLDLDFNQIRDISALGGLRNLTELRLWSNLISDISVLGRLTELTYLDLYANEISDISPLNTLGNLDYLDIRENPLSSFQVAELRLYLLHCDIAW